jgi:hypothetical protein
MRLSIVTSLLAFALATAPAGAASLPTTTAGMLALVKATHQLKIDTSVPASTGYEKQPFIAIAGAPEGTAGGYIDAEYAQRGTLSDGTHMLFIPLDSGGSGGVFTQLVFAQKPDHSPAYIGYLSSGGHLDVRVKSGAIVAELPDYGPNDPNCCPSHYLHQHYTIEGGKLHLVSTTRTTKM